MIKYAKIINNETGLCEVGLGTNTKYYISIGMTEIDVDKSDVDNKWYTVDKCPHKSEEEKEREERERKDAMTLTPADVERALYKAKEMDFEDLKALIVQALPTVDIKALSIEFRAKDFYRGAVANGMRLFDVVGALLNITSEQLDKFFETKDYHYLMDEDNNDL